MTYNEIVKALEDWIKNYDGSYVNFKILGNALDFITRQQFEIEGFQKTEIEMDDFCRRICRMRMLNGNTIATYEDLQSYIQEEKAKAQKEFAEELKNSIKKSVDDAWHSDGNGIYDAECVLDDIDNLLKEKVSDDNDR